MDGYLTKHPCALCGENRIWVLTFHHLRDKDSGVAEMVSRGASVESIRTEIEKCVVLCRNCHADLHHRERQRMTGDSVVV